MCCVQYLQELRIKHSSYYEGDNGAKVVDRVLGSENYEATGDIENTFYNSGVKDNDYRTQNIPTYILEKLSSDPTSRKNMDGYVHLIILKRLAGCIR